MIHNFEYGSIFIGFAGDIICKNCNNKSIFTIHQKYNKQSLFYIIPLITTHHDIYKRCPVCEAKTKIYSAGILSGGGLEQVHHFLEKGKYYTLNYYQKSAHKNKKYILKRLSAINAHHLVGYIEENA